MKMLNNLKKNVKNKAWWVAVISLILLILQSKGLDITKYIGADWQTTLNNIFTLSTLIGISVDTTSSSPINTIETTQTDNTEVQTESETTANTNTLSNISDAKLEQIKDILYS